VLHRYHLKEEGSVGELHALLPCRAPATQYSTVNEACRIRLACCMRGARIDAARSTAALVILHAPTMAAAAIAIATAAAAITARSPSRACTRAVRRLIALSDLHRNLTRRDTRHSRCASDERDRALMKDRSWTDGHGEC
jgi:hypothetical protein